MKRTTLLIAKYCIIAAISILVNMIVQFSVNYWVKHYLVGLVETRHAERIEHLFIYVGILAGATVALVVKYALDKRFIFQFTSRSSTHDAKVFAQYSLMSTVPTAIYWISELSFHYIYDGENAKYIGGVVGLTIGYLIKYRLDKKWVFAGPRQKEYNNKQKQIMSERQNSSESSRSHYSIS